MRIVNYLLKSEYRICWKHFTRSISHYPADSSWLRSTYQKHLGVRLNHDSIIPVNKYKKAENEYYHSYLARNKKYAGTIAFLDYTPESVSRDVDSILNEAFEDKHGVTLIAYLHAALEHSRESAAIYDDARFIKLCETLSSKVTTLHEDHVLNVLKVLTMWDESKRDAAFYDVCRTIDKMFLQRYKLWGFDRCLQIIDHFYRLQVLRFSETVWNLMKRLWRDPNK